MQSYRLKEGIEFFAATPETANAEFIRLAGERGIVLADIILRGTEKAKVFLSGYNIITEQNEYLIITSYPQLRTFTLAPAMFNALFEHVGNSDMLPDPPEEVIVPRLLGKSFCLDAGHGGKDSGAVNDNLGLQEKIAALDVCLKLGKMLEAQAATVAYTRLSNSDYPSLTARANAANAMAANAFVSIHLNSAENKSAQGIETLVYALKDNAFELATIIQKNMVAATGWKNRGVKERPNLTVLKKTKMPAILCEIGFISNDKEAQELFKPEVQDKIASAICDGIVAFYGN